MTSPFSPAPTHAVRLAWRALGLLTLGNWLYGGFVAAMGIALLVAPDATMSRIGVRDDVDRTRIRLAMYAVVVIGLAGAALVHRLLKTLRAIVATVGEGDPFVPGNATRLETIGRQLLALELLHLAVGLATALGSSAEQPFDLDWSFSLTPWLTILLVFVLARVFREGTRMRHDLAGVV
ncbi:MAG: hypothetical protein C0503_02750 [Gemmatimonas sp.]|nr:hypothetical protein [Gemmatimonas sp.]